MLPKYEIIITYNNQFTRFLARNIKEIKLILKNNKFEDIEINLYNKEFERFAIKYIPLVDTFNGFLSNATPKEIVKIFEKIRKDLKNVRL